MIKKIFAVFLVLFLIPLNSCNFGNFSSSFRDDIPTNEIAQQIERSLANKDLLADASPRYTRANVSATSTDRSAAEYVVKTSLCQVIDEYGVFRAFDVETAREICEEINISLDRRREEWDDRYYSEEKPKIEAAKAVQYGKYVIYGVLSPDELSEIFDVAKKIIQS